MTDVDVEAPAVDVRELEAGADEARDAYVSAHERGTFFHLSGWRNVVERVYGHAPRELAAWRGDRLVGVLPMMLCRGLRRRPNLVSMPYAVYGGPVADGPDVRRRLVERARELGEELRVGYLGLRYLHDPGDDLPTTDLYCTFLRDLPEEPEGILRGMPKKARAEARKGRDRHGLQLAEGEYYVDDLARLFLENKHSLGSPGLPVEHFRALLEEFGNRRVFVHLARKERLPVAAVMSFAFGETLIAYYAGTRTGADRELSASNFMYMALQEWAVRRGFRRFDFCRSRADSGAFRFKQHQGFEPTPLHYRHVLVRSARQPAFTPSNPSTRPLQRAWSSLPLWLARRLSDRLARYLP